MAKKRPSDKQMLVIRRRHALREIRETLSYSLGWPERYIVLMAAWNYMVYKRDDSKPDWYGWFYFLGRQAPQLSFDPFNDN